MNGVSANVNKAHRVLLVPGLRNSGPAHWQTLWERAHPDYRRVVQRDWDDPKIEIWADAIGRELQASELPAILVAHSVGCLAAVQSARRAGGRVCGAMLVAPADPQRFAVEAALPREPLGFPTILVASSSDPWLSLAHARTLARDWCSNLVNLGNCGHINAESGYGAWPVGERLLYELQKLIGTPQPVRQLA